MTDKKSIPSSVPARKPPTPTSHSPVTRTIIAMMVSLASLALWSLVSHPAVVEAWSPFVARQVQQPVDGSLSVSASSSGAASSVPGSTASASRSSVVASSSSAAQSGVSGAGTARGTSVDRSSTSSGPVVSATASRSSATASRSGSASGVSAASSALSASGSASLTTGSSSSAVMSASTVTDATGGVTVYMTSISTVTAPGTCAPAPTESLVPGTTIPDGYTSPQIPYPLVAESDYFHGSKWTAAHARAREYLQDWTVEEKSQLSTGRGWSFGQCVGNIPPIPSQDFPGLCLQDGPLGVRFTDRVSAFPAGVNSATTFDKDLMYARGKAMGSEFKAKGVNIALGPSIDMARNAAGGRNWEAFGGDPYLTGWAAEMTIRGMQDAGVQATAKHFIGNNQERNRTTSSSNIDDRTMREIYTHPYLRAVAADVAAVMCSYNLINGTWGCQNSKTQNGILKTDFGFQGFIVSDWTATHSGVNAVNSGEDMDMPGDVTFGSLTSFFGQNLTDGVNNGSIATKRLDDMAERIMAGYFMLNQDQNYPEVSFDSFRRPGGENNSHVNVQKDHAKLIREIGAASTVLLKNVDGTLPLKAPETMALIGQDLGPSWLGPNGWPDRGGLNGTLAMGWGSGTAEFPYLIDPLQAIVERARKDGTDIDWWFDNYDLEGATTVATAKEVVIVGINSDSGEQYITVDGNEGDRNNLTAWYNGGPLVESMAANFSNVIVVVHSVGPIDMEAWIDHPNVTAVLWAGLPGQESGHSLVDVLYGDYNPSGRLPYTIAKDRADYGSDIDYVTTNDPVQTNVEYTEMLNIDYRHFLAEGIEPRYPFGFGLSYTQFNYTNLKIVENGGAEARQKDQEMEAYWKGETGGNETRIGAFLRDSLQRKRWTITAQVQNTGDVYGCDVPQLYLAFPESAGEPPKVLRDFNRVRLNPWETKEVKFELSRYDVSYWDVITQDWVVPEGDFGLIVGKHSMDESLTATHVFADPPSADAAATTTAQRSSASASASASASVSEGEADEDASAYDDVEDETA